MTMNLPLGESPITTVTHTIQLAIAPVFLLTALGTFLGVLSTRLGRIVDRARVLGDRAAAAPEDARARLREEAALLSRRRHLVNLAITGGVTSALLVCTLIASAFVGSVVRADVSVLLAALFVGAMVAFISALLLFLREILMAAVAVHIDPQ
jgi:hypothetical protein